MHHASPGVGGAGKVHTDVNETERNSGSKEERRLTSLTDVSHCLMGSGVHWGE